MAEPALGGFGVLVTRPAAQAVELIDAIEASGGTAFPYPVIEIVCRNDAAIVNELTKLPDADIAIFASPNAVEFGARHVDAKLIGAIGPSTAAALSAAGLSVAVVPADGYDSESLLRHPLLQDVAGRHICIVRGDGGRDLLAKTLQSRGAHVSYLSVYDRVRPTMTPGQRSAIESAWRSGMIGAITVMSVATLDNLAALLPDWCRRRLDSIPLVTPASRVIQEALHRFPASMPVLAKGPQAADMLKAIISIHRTGSGQAS